MKCLRSPKNRSYMSCLIIAFATLFIPMVFPQETDDNKKATPPPRSVNKKRNIQTDEMVTRGLGWLARHQTPDGAWSAKLFRNQCEDSQCTGTGDEYYDIGLTGLALLAFTGAGYTPDDKEIHNGISFGGVTRKAADNLIDTQLSDGAFGGIKPGYKFMYNQAIATYALADIYYLTEDNIYKEPLEKAVKCIIEAQNPGKGWRYQPKDGESDSSVTGWVFMALKTAESAGIAVPPSAFSGIKSFFNKITEPKYGKVGYTSLGSVAIFGYEDPREIVIQPSLTAIGVLVRLFLEKGATTTTIEKGVKIVTASQPKWASKTGTIDYYYWFYGSSCLYKYDGPQGPCWGQWNKTTTEVLAKNQKTKKNTCACGSWDALERRSRTGLYYGDKSPNP
ncbi:MAG: terpene cyclase/mutase family protein [Planctomycetes bacterium]|nr:terpene cyclase/mutase family protein [Planctomycetota bacterium]